MIEISVKNIDKISNIIEKSARSTEKSIGFFAMQKFRNYINDQNLNKWKPLRNLTKNLINRNSGGFFSSKRWTAGDSPLAWLSFFVRFSSNQKNKASVYFQDKSSSFLGYSSHIDDYIKKAETGASVPVSPLMRRFFAFEQRRSKQKVFLRKSTKSLKIPRRPIFNPVVRILKKDVPENFQSTFVKKLNDNLGNK